MEVCLSSDLTGWSAEVVSLEETSCFLEGSGSCTRAASLSVHWWCVVPAPEQPPPQSIGGVYSLRLCCLESRLMQVWPGGACVESGMGHHKKQRGRFVLYSDLRGFRLEREVSLKSPVSS